jgi:hypothetical protein
MEIKRQLKNFDVRLSKFARELNISRPTLDSYIEYFEQGKPIPNEVCQQAFNSLFSTESLTAVEFAKKYDFVRRNILENYSANLSQCEKDEREIKLSNNIISILHQKNIDLRLLEFVNLLITNAEKGQVQALALYFNLVNGFVDIEKVDISAQNKAFFAKLYKIFAEYKSNSISYDDIIFTEFIEKSKKMYNAKNQASDAEKLIRYIQNSVSDDSNIDYEYIRKILSSEVK